MTIRAVLLWCVAFWLAAAVALLAFAGPADAASTAPRLSDVAEVPVYTVPWTEWPDRRFDALTVTHVPDATTATPIAILLSPKIYRPLVRALNGWHPLAFNARVDLTWAIYVLGQALAQAHDPECSERSAQTWAGRNFERLAARMGIGPYHRRALKRTLTAGEPHP